MKVIALYSFVHDGKSVMAGDSLEITDDAAKRLSHLNFVRYADTNIEYNVVVEETQEEEKPVDEVEPVEETQEETQEIDATDDIDSEKISVDDMTKEDLQRELTSIGIPFDKKTDIDTLRKLYIEALTAE